MYNKIAIITTINSNAVVPVASHAIFSPHPLVLR